MTQRSFNITAGIIFFVVGFVHALRLIMGWSVIIDGWVVPLWASIFGLLIPAAFTYYAFRFVAGR